MLSKSAQYALRAVVCLAREPDVALPADVLAASAKVPLKRLSAVLQALGRVSLVRVQSGTGGGYRFAAVPTKVTVLDVVNAVSPIGRPRNCPLGTPSHAICCLLHAELNDVYAAAERALARVTIARLLDDAEPTPPVRAAAASAAAVPVVFACSGCSNAGQLANQLALELDRRGIAEMSCLAGVGAAKATFLKKIQGREVWVIDGCPIECSHGVFELARERVDVHVRLFEMGIRKNVELPAGIALDQLVEDVLRHVAQQKATQRERSHK